MEVEVALHHLQAKTASPLVPLRVEATHTLRTDALPGFPHDAPSVFSLYQFRGGFSHLTAMTAMLLFSLILPTQK